MNDVSPSGASGHHHGSKNSRILACVLCQHRKIKCDRNMPCSNCVKANVTCTPSTPAPARKRRRPNQDLQERLARCEDLLKKYAHGQGPGQVPGQLPQQPLPQISQRTPVSPATTTTSQPEQAAKPLPAADAYIKWKPAGKMVKEEGSVRFMDSYLWASVYDELQAMRNIVLESDDVEESSILGSEDHTPENNADLFFPQDAGTPTTEELQPDPVHVFRLWQLFLDRVNPVTKVVHVPTLQPYVMEAATSMSTLPLNYQALLYSIFTMAIISINEEECASMIAMSRDTALQKFSQGVRRSLGRYNFLKNHDMPVLQALLLYVISLQNRFDRHATWILSGTVVRIAQKMGYHRDGEQLNLPPFEAEMRRRIWWMIVIQDAKNALISGLSHSLLPSHWDSKEPLNINDADLFPSSEAPLQAREGPTEMAFCLMFYQIAKFMVSSDAHHGMPGFEAAVLGSELAAQKDPTVSNKKSLEKYRALVGQLEENLMEVETKYVVGSAGRIHAAAMTIRPMLINKLREMLVPMQEQPEWGTEIFGPKDNLFKVVIMNNEHNTEAYDTMAGNGFLWFVKLHFQMDVFSVMTGQLAQRPTGTLSDRAWKNIEIIYRFHPEISDMSVKANCLQAQFTLRAWRAREQAYAQAGRPLQEPGFITRLRELTPSDSSRSTQASITPPTINMQAPQQLTELDPYLGGFLDVSALNWDMWADPTSATMQPEPLGAYDMMTLAGAMGPTSGMGPNGL